MATITRTTAQTNSDAVRTETTPGANTATRVGQLFRDLSDSVAFTADLAAAIAAGITESAVRTALAALTAAPDFNAKKISNVADPAAAQDVATKTSSEAVVTAARVLTALAAAAGSIAVNAQKITGLANGTAIQDAAALGQISGVMRWNGSSTVGNSTSARFLANNCSATAGAASDATEAAPHKRQMAGKAGKLTRIDFQLDTALAAGDLTITVRLNGVDTALTCTLAHGSLVSAGGTGSVTVAATDFIGIKVVSSAADATTSNPVATVQLAAA